MTAPMIVGSLGRNDVSSSLRHSIVTDVSTLSLGRLVASIAPRPRRREVRVDFHVVDSLAAIAKLLPLPSSTGGTGKASTHSASASRPPQRALLSQTMRG
jgi:hypothetical protein